MRQSAIALPDVQKRLARCGCGVNRLICGFKRNGFALERSNNILKVRHRPSQPVNSGHDECVARPKELQKRFQLAAAFPGCAGPLFRTDNFASGRFQLFDLDRKVLLLGTHTGIAVQWH